MVRPSACAGTWQAAWRMLSNLGEAGFKAPVKRADRMAGCRSHQEAVDGACGVEKYETWPCLSREAGSISLCVCSLLMQSPGRVSLAP